METITETIITESTMIGHNPSIPGGEGFGKGITTRADRLDIMKKGLEYILLMDKSITYERAAEIINLLAQMEIDVKGVILESDEGVLVSNRIQKIIPIIDEVKGIDSIPEGVMAALYTREILSALSMIVKIVGANKRYRCS